MWFSQFTDEETKAQRGSRLPQVTFRTPRKRQRQHSPTGCPPSRSLLELFSLYRWTLQLKDHREASVLSDGDPGTSLNFSAASFHSTCPITGLCWRTGRKRMGWRAAVDGQEGGRRRGTQATSPSCSSPRGTPNTQQLGPNGRRTSSLRQGKVGWVPSHPDYH